MGVPTLCIAWQSKHDSQTALLASTSTSICLNQCQHLPQSASISICLNQHLPQSVSASASISLSICLYQSQHLSQSASASAPMSICLESNQLHCIPRLMASDRQYKLVAVAPPAQISSCSRCDLELSSAWCCCTPHTPVLSARMSDESPTGSSYILQCY